MTHVLSPFQLFLQSLQRLARTATLSIAVALMLAFTAPSAQAQCIGTITTGDVERCNAGNVTFNAIFGIGGGTITWRRNGTALANGVNGNGTIVSGQGTTALTLTSVAVGDAGNYTVSYSLGVPFFCNGTSPAVTLTVATSLAFTVQPVGTTVCGGVNIGLTVANTGSPTGYQWRRNAVNLVNGVNANGTTITGATTASLSLSSIDPADAGSYTCVIDNACSTLTSSTASVVVRLPATITLNPVSSANCEGDTVDFTMNGFATAPSTLQWRRNGVNLVNGLNGAGTLISGANSVTLTLIGISPSDGGTYTCAFANVCNSVITSGAVLTVAGVPTITNPPDPVTICSGLNTAFTVAASSPGGGALTFRWRRNGVNLVNGVNGFGTNVAGVTTTTLTLSSVAIGDAGTYTCAVTNSCPLNNTTISVGALLTIETASSIASSPTSRAACELGSTSFFVGVLAGSPAPTVQWQFNGVNLADGFGVSGATTTTLTLTSLSPADAGNYRAIVTSPCSTSFSANAALTINPQVVITLQPISQTVCQFVNVTFSTAATGFAPITFQWFKDSVALANGSGVSGVTTSILSLTSVSRLNSGVYFCRITNPCDVDVTFSRTLTVQDVLITTQPVNEVACETTTASFSIIADGTPAPTFQWQRNGVNLVNGVNANGTTIAGATASTLTLSSVAPADAGNFQCIVTNACDVDFSVTRTLIVDTRPTVSTPLAVTTCEGNNPSFTAVITGSPAPTLRWQRNGLTLVDGANVNGTIISGANTPTLTLGSVDPADAGSYRCIASNTCAVITGGAAALVVNLDTRIGTSPADRTICPGANTNFVVGNVTGNLPVTLQWRRNGVNLINGVNANGTTIAGVTTAVLSLTSVAAGDAGTYTCLASGGCGSVLSTNAALIIGTPVIIATQPIGGTQCAGTTKLFTVAASATPAPSFQWQKAGVNISDGISPSGTAITGATTATLSLAGIDISDASAYRCVISTPCDTTFSNSAALNVSPGTFITSSPVPVAILVGSNASFSVVASGTGPITFQWQRNNVNVVNGVQASGSTFGGVTAATLSITAAAPGDTGNYRCVITSPCGSQNTATAALVPATNLGTSSNNTLTGSLPMPANSIRWFRFTTTADAVDPDRYLDIHSVGSTVTDTEIGLYRTDGTRVADNDDVVLLGFSLLSFGQTAPTRTYPPLVGDAAGGAGTLPAGTYYVAVGGFNMTFGTTGFNITASNPAGTYSVTVVAGTAVNPCLADVNNDGTVDGNDFTAFINSYGVGDPAIDPIADVNLDGVIDGNDFVAFINAFGAGC